MKIKILQSVAGQSYSYSEGDTVDAPDDIAKDLIKAKYATAIKPAKKTASRKTKNLN